MNKNKNFKLWNSPSEENTKFLFVAVCWYKAVWILVLDFQYKWSSVVRVLSVLGQYCRLWNYSLEENDKVMSQSCCEHKILKINRALLKYVLNSLRFLKPSRPILIELLITHCVWFIWQEVRAGNWVKLVKVVGSTSSERIQKEGHPVPSYNHGKSGVVRRKGRPPALWQSSASSLKYAFLIMFCLIILFRVSIVIDAAGQKNSQFLSCNQLLASTTYRSTYLPYWLE